MPFSYANTTTWTRSRSPSLLRMRPTWTFTVPSETTEPVAAAEGSRMMLLLIGVNCGCLLTLWGSLATLLWPERCIAAGIHISWWSFLWRGLVLTPLVLAGTVLAVNLS